MQLLGQLYRVRRRWQVWKGYSSLGCYHVCQFAVQTRFKRCNARSFRVYIHYTRAVLKCVNNK